MLRSIKELIGYNVQGLDDMAGHLGDFYFDDVTWTVHYLIIDTGTWLPGRRVLVSPLAVGQPDWMNQVFPVNLNREQIEHSPDIDVEKPLSREHEQVLVEYYDWPPYWDNVSPIEANYAGLYGADYLKVMRAISAERDEALIRDKLNAPTLHSFQGVTGYAIEAQDGEIGHVDDFIADDRTWTIRYMVIDTRNWLPGKKVLVAPEWIEYVNWQESRVHVDLHRTAIKNAPGYDLSAPINREYEMRLYDFHGRPGYWT